MMNHAIQSGGYIYIVKCNLHKRAYKLGFTKNPDKRLYEYNKYGVDHCPSYIHSNEGLSKKNIIEESIKTEWEYVYLKQMKLKYPASVMEWYLFGSISLEFDPWDEDRISSEWEYSRYFENDNDFINFVDTKIQELLSNKNKRQRVLLSALKHKFNIDDKFFSPLFYAQTQ